MHVVELGDRWALRRSSLIRKDYEEVILCFFGTTKTKLLILYIMVIVNIKLDTFRYNTDCINSGATYHV